MRLFHYSDVDATILIPSIGDRRHDGEDPRAVGKPVLWLSSAQMRQNPIKAFEYTVEVEPDDPMLFVDQPFARGIEAMAKQFGSGSGWRWYWLEREIVPIEKRRWVATSRAYEPVA